MTRPDALGAAILHAHTAWINFPLSLGHPPTRGVNQFFRFDTAGQMNGTIYAASPGPGVGIIEANSIGANGGIHFASGRIARVRTESGDFHGFAATVNGSIGTIDIAGAIGSSTSPVSIRATTGIDSIIGTSITGFITAYTDPATGIGKLGRLETTVGDLAATVQTKGFNESITGAGIFVAGDLKGEIGFPTGSTITRPISITGKIDGASNGRITSDVSLVGPNGKITVGGDVSGNINFRQTTSAINGQITIGGDLKSTASILATGGITSSSLIQIGGSLQGTVKLRKNTELDGHVLINANNSTGSWASTGQFIRENASDVNIFTLATTQSQPNQAPEYDRLSADLGGGSVGVAPFKLHETDCSPAYSASPPANQFLQTELDGSTSPPDWTAKTVTLSFYGPVRTDANIDHVGVDTSEMPVTIEWIDEVNEVYVDVTHRWRILMAHGASAPSHEVKLHGLHFDTDPSARGMYVGVGLYRVKPRLTGTARLYCDGMIAATKPAVADFTYYFTVGADCNRNGTLDTVPDEQCSSPTGFCLAD